jgi:Flp pilus assembly protein protease CpaA
MFEVIFLGILGVIWLFFASVHDLRKRLVYNWTCMSLIIFSLGFRFFYSLFSERSFMFFYQGLLFVLIFYVVSNLFYYLRMYAGGDSSLMVAMGAILPMYDSFISNLSLILGFLLVFLFIGAVYGFIWSVFLAIIHRKKFSPEFWKIFRKNKRLIYLLMVFGLFFMILGFSQGFISFLFGVFVFLFSTLWVFAKAVDNSSMIKEISPRDLIPGDWLFESVKIGKKEIKPNWDGLSEEDIKLLKKRKKKVFVREGIPFVPVFLISYVIYLLNIIFSFKVFY